MKKKLLSLAIAGASLVAANSYAAGPTVYGKLNVSLQQIDTEVSDGTDAVTDEDTWKLLSNASRLGVMGDVDINSDLKAIYKLEYEVYVDDGDDGAGTSSEFSQRNIYAGLQGKSWGTLIAGKNDSPLKMSQGKADQFNDMYLGDIKHIMVGENRPSNIIMYSTPNMSGLILTAAIMPGEETEADNAPAGAPESDDGIADYISLAGEYKIDALRLAAAYDGDVSNNDVIRLTAEYAMDQFELGAIYQMAEASDDDVNDDGDALDEAGFEAYLDDANIYGITTLIGDMEQNAWIISGAFKANDKLKVKAQVGMAETELTATVPVGPATVELDAGDLETQLIAVGVDYALAASTTLYGYYANVSWDDKAPSDVNVDDVDGDGTTFGVGIDHKF